MTIVAILIVAIFAERVLRTYRWQFQAKRDGTETDASVSWIEKSRGSYRGEEYIWYYYYVRFLRADGTETEARLLNPKKSLVRGSRVRIRYLPERDSCAVLTKILQV